MITKTKYTTPSIAIGEHYLLDGRADAVYAGYDELFKEHEFVRLFVGEDNVRIIALNTIGNRNINLDERSVFDRRKIFSTMFLRSDGWHTDMEHFSRLLKIIEGNLR